jgi:hypothetical protein
MIYWEDMKRFIRVISKIHPDPNRKRFVLQFLNQDVPWEQLILLAQSEGVDGLLYHHLCRLDDCRIPEASWDCLGDMHLGYQRNQAKIIKAVQFISEHLQQSKLSAIALKGLSLIQIYKIPGIRPMGDMDILVKPDERDRVVNLLQDIGYQIPNPVYPNNLIKNRLWLDVHTHILNLDRIRSRRHVFTKDMSALWDRALPLFESSTGILSPDPIDNFVLLSLHALKHSYSRTIWLVDLYELLQDIVSQADGWHKIIRRARYWQQERIVSYGLKVLEGVLGVTIPEWVKEKLKFEQLGPIEKYLLRLRIKGFNRPEYYIALWFLSIQGIRNRLEFLRETAFPQDDTMDQIYLKSSTHNRIARWIGRLIQSVILLGNGIGQALSHGPFGRF